MKQITNLSKNLKYEKNYLFVVCILFMSDNF